VFFFFLALQSLSGNLSLTSRKSVSPCPAFLYHGYGDFSIHMRVISSTFHSLKVEGQGCPTLARATRATVNPALHSEGFDQLLSVKRKLQISFKHFQSEVA